MSEDPTRIDISFDPTKRRMVGVARHGNTPFDVPFISNIAYNLWQGGCENGLVLPKNIKHLVSLYPWEAYTVKHELQSSLAVIMYDSLDQAFDQIDAIARWINVCRESGPVLVHCQAGLNRSSLVAARALMLSGKTADDAIALLRERRSPACLCNTAFEDWLRNLDPPVYCELKDAVKAAADFWVSLEPKAKDRMTVEETQRNDDATYFITLSFSERGMLYDEKKQTRMFVIDAVKCTATSMYPGTIDDYERQQNVEA